MFKPQFKSWAFVLIFFIIYGIIFKNVYMITMMIVVNDERISKLEKGDQLDKLLIKVQYK